MEQLFWASAGDVAPSLTIGQYLELVFIGNAYFCAQHVVLHYVIKFFYPKYLELNQRDFHDYRMQVNALIHAALAALFSLYGLFAACPDDKTFFNDVECRLVPRNCHVWTCFFTASYLLVETIFIWRYLGFDIPIDRQTFLHHIVAFVNFYLAFWEQDFTVTIGSAFILMEISTVFVVLRWLLFHHGYKGSSLQALNSVLLFCTFIFGRVIYQSYLVYAFMWDWLMQHWFEKENVTLIYKLILLEMFTAVLINVALNFLWSYLIFRQLYRMIFKGSGDNHFEGDQVKEDEVANGEEQRKIEMQTMLDPAAPKSDSNV